MSMNTAHETLDAEFDDAPAETSANEGGALAVSSGGQAVTPMQMIDRAMSNGAGVEVLDKLMALQERWEANQGRKAFDNAVADAKAELPVIIKNREVDFTSQKGRTHYKHEDLAGIAEQINPILSRHGLSYRYRSQIEGDKVFVTCIVSHRDGYSEETTLDAVKDQSGNKNHIQAIGSAVTYLQRYTLKIALGLAAAEDDDGRKSEQASVITKDQADELQAMIEEVGADKGRFLAYMGVDKLGAIPAAQYDRAVAAIEAKRKAQ